MIKTSAIIFDLDGVLADSEPWWNQIDARLLAERGITYRGEYHENVVGVSYQLAVEFYKKAFGLSASTKELMKRRGEIASEFFAERIGLFPKVKEVLEQLQQMNLPSVRLGLATSSVSASARPFLDRQHLTKFFEVIVTGEEVERGKPAPDIYLCAAEKLRIPASECLVIEDALAGIAAAKAAKMRVVAIPDKRPSGLPVGRTRPAASSDRFVDPTKYEKDADYVLGSLTELPALVRKLAVDF
jgi:HAD superfamily hydrolase (TIGR01509 family)